MKDLSKDGRYPYTYACDYIRSFGGYSENGMKLSRSDASRIRTAIAVAIGMDDRVLAEKLANVELANTNEDIEKIALALTSAVFNTRN